MSTVRLVVIGGLIAWLMVLSAVVDWGASLGRRDGPPEMFDY